MTASSRYAARGARICEAGPLPISTNDNLILVYLNDTLQPYLEYDSIVLFLDIQDSAAFLFNAEEKGKNKLIAHVGMFYTSFLFNPKIITAGIAEAVGGIAVGGCINSGHSSTVKPLR